MAGAEKIRSYIIDKAKYIIQLSTNLNKLNASVKGKKF